MPLFVQKLKFIEAVRLVPGCYDDVVNLIGEVPGDKYGYICGLCHPGGPLHGMQVARMSNGFEIWIKNNDNTAVGYMGDWVIKEGGGKFSVCDNEVFEKTYVSAEI